MRLDVREWPPPVEMGCADWEGSLRGAGVVALISVHVHLTAYVLHTSM